uniref:Uncharacterized protein n=1 Tax=Arundo donax TaxID=35708 RepID=A0A0A9HU72_ARUDO
MQKGRLVLHYMHFLRVLITWLVFSANATSMVSFFEWLLQRSAIVHKILEF